MEHISRVKVARHGVTYLSKDIQDDLYLMGNQIRNTVINRIKATKYFSVLLDCTPHFSWSNFSASYDIFIYRMVKYKYVKVLLVVKDTSGLELATTLKQHLNDYGFDFTNYRGQEYNNGINMKGFKSGVQTQLLRKNQSFFYTMWLS